jgi:ATP-dependent Lon protease
MPGKGHVEITGQLGDVMKESARAALTYVRSHAPELGVEPEFLASQDVHIHVPEGATPKDGPSAGITIATSLVSAVTRIPVRHDVAMTGEITLRGRVMAIGGLKEKALAAHRAGCKTVIIPADNKKDLPDIPEAVPDCLRRDIVGVVRELARRWPHEFFLWASFGWEMPGEVSWRSPCGRSPRSWRWQPAFRSHVGSSSP